MGWVVFQQSYGTWGKIDRIHKQLETGICLMVGDIVAQRTERASVLISSERKFYSNFVEDVNEWEYLLRKMMFRLAFVCSDYVCDDTDYDWTPK